MVSRLRAMMSNKTALLASPTTQRMHDFDAIIFQQHMRVMTAARHDLAIDFDRNTSLGQSFELQEPFDRAVAIKLARVAIQSDLHVAHCAVA